MSSQLAQYTNKRPTTAASLSSRNVSSGFSFGNSGHDLKRFRCDFPNLPGFSKFSSLRPQSPKNQSLHFKNGYMMANSPLPRSIKTNFSLDNFPLSRPSTAPSTATSSSSLISREVTSPNDFSGRYSLTRQKKDRENNNISLPFCADSKLPSFLEHDRRVLMFHGYYEEDVLQSTIEDKRIIKCEIYFYVEDGTIEIIQKKQQNSGIPQGVFLRRKRVEKPNKSGAMDSFQDFYGIDDLKIGNEVEIYSRIFHILDCNQSTREYVIANHGWQRVDVVSLPFPRDAFAEVYKTKMRRESGVPGVDRKRKMHDLKEVMESMLGKQLSTTDRGMFLKCGQDALCFDAVWDDRERLYGDIQFYQLFYYLADDTIEILPVQKKNDGRYHFPKLLKRMKLPKDSSYHAEDSDRTSYYSWRDLCIGKKIDVFGRSMLLARCDSYTREHYKSQGIMLNEDKMSLEPQEQKIECVRHIPPYNGFGSEEDSLRSCTGGINPPPPKRDLARNRDKQGVSLIFNARMISDKANRKFIIQYFMEDDTIGIQEPPIRNSGVMGGKFLRRQSIKKHNGDKYLAADMWVGNVVDFMCHHFELLDADEHTYRLMENDHKNFKYSDYGSIHEVLDKTKDEICKYFATKFQGSHKIDFDQLVECCSSVGLKLNKQQMITLWRKIDKQRNGKVSFTKLIRLVEGGKLC